MNNLDLIFIGIGFVTLLTSLLLLVLRLVKGNHKVSAGIISLLVTGIIFLSVGIGFIVSTDKEKVVNEVSKEEVLTLAEVPNSKGEGAIEGNLVVDNETELQKIARKLVEQEMSKQVDLKEWEITENKVTSDNNVNNISDYDKPEGDMRIVWIAGYVKAISDDGITGNVGYTLELYQIKDDINWYIGNHWGILADLVVTDKPAIKGG